MTDSCVIWQARCDRGGYGVAYVAGKTCGAHRVAYTEAYGEIPFGLCVLHSCDTPACINPAHLSLGTHKQNMEQRSQRGRAPFGSRQPHAKLSDEKVRLIRASGKSVRALAAEFGCSKSVVHRAKVGEKWAHVK